ncbi:MAG: hypothetical protein MJ213_01240 [Bacilli bacterium]|nr:hypothetical protein [Bacilli bacterium]
MNFKKLTYLFALCPLALAGLSSCGVNGARTPGKVLTFTEARDYVKEHFSSEVDNIQERITKTLDLTMSTSGISVDGFFSFPKLEIQPTHIDFKLPAQDDLKLSLSNASGASGAAYVKNALSKIAGPATNNVLNKGKSAQAGDSGLEILDYAVACIANPFLTTPVLDFVNTYVSQVENIDIINQTFTLDSRNTFYYTVEIADLAKLTKIFEQYEKIFPSKLPTFIRGQDGYAYASISFDDQGFATGLDINIHSNSLEIQMPNQGSGEESTTIYDGLLDANLTATLKHHFYDPAKLHHIGVDQPTANAKYDILAIQSETEYNQRSHYTNGQRKLVDSWDTYKYLAPYHETLLPGFGTDVILEAPQGSTISQEDLSINIGGRLYDLDDFLVPNTDTKLTYTLNNASTDGPKSGSVVVEDGRFNLSVLTGENGYHVFGQKNNERQMFMKSFAQKGFVSSNILNSFVKLYNPETKHHYDVAAKCGDNLLFGYTGEDSPIDFTINAPFFDYIKGQVLSLELNALPQYYIPYDFTNPATGNPVAYVVENAGTPEETRSSYGIIPLDGSATGMSIVLEAAPGYANKQELLEKIMKDKVNVNIGCSNEADKQEFAGIFMPKYDFISPTRMNMSFDSGTYQKLFAFVQNKAYSFGGYHPPIYLAGVVNDSYLFNPCRSDDGFVPYSGAPYIIWSTEKIKVKPTDEYQPESELFSPVYGLDGEEFGITDINTPIELSIDKGYAFPAKPDDFYSGGEGWLNSIGYIRSPDGGTIHLQELGDPTNIFNMIQYDKESNKLIFPQDFIALYNEYLDNTYAPIQQDCEIRNKFSLVINTPIQVEPEGPTSIVANTIAVEKIDDRHIYLQVLPTLSDIVDADISIHINKQHN